jgi:hypothetical protein
MTINYDTNVVPLATAKEPKLTIEMVPSPCWHQNARFYNEDFWDIIRYHIYGLAGYTCQICGKKCSEKSGELECHEKFHYNEELGIQTIVGLQALCYWCHAVKHYDRSKGKGVDETLLFAHLCRINDATPEEGVRYLNKKRDECRRRAKLKWAVDFSYLKERFLIPAKNS